MYNYTIAAQADTFVTVSCDHRPHGRLLKRFNRLLPPPPHRTRTLRSEIDTQVLAHVGRGMQAQFHSRFLDGMHK